jgi:hypothetical protein
MLRFKTAMSTGNPSSPQSGFLRFTLGGLQQVAGWVASVLPDRDQQLVWQEFRNKALVFGLFANVESVLQLTPGQTYSAAELVERALRLDPFESVWAMEGIGHFLAERHLDGRQPFIPPDSAGVPAHVFVALHVGMGLSFANRSLSTLMKTPSPLEVRQAVESFTRLCKLCSTPGFEPVAFEALGLVTRNVYPHLVQSVARQSAGIDPELEEYFWHGVGRGLYFLPGNAMPASCAPWIAIKAAEREAPHEMARRNMLAGLVWAVTLVNLRHPEIPALFLKHHSNVLCQDDVFRNGLASAILIWLASSPQDPSLKSFFLFHPDAGDRNFCRLWNDQVKYPCRNMLREGGLRPEELLPVPTAFRYKPYA